MDETYTVKWNKINDAYHIHDLLRAINDYNISNVEIDHDKQESLIQLTSDKFVSEKNFIIIPSLLAVQDKKVFYGNIVEFQIKQFPTIMTFIKTYCPYINDFIQNEKIESIKIHSGIIFIHNQSNSLSEMSFQIEKINKKIELLFDVFKATPLILVAIIKKFYNGKDHNEFSSPFIFSNHRHLSNIVNENSLMNKIIERPMSYLQTYNIELSSESINYSSSLGMYRFVLAENEFFATPNMEPYKQLMEIKFIDYIINR